MADQLFTAIQKMGKNVVDAVNTYEVRQVVDKVFGPPSSPLLRAE